MQRKVIIIGPAYPLRGGIANFNEALYHALDAAGSDVEIVSFSMQYPKVLFPGKSQKESDTRPDPGLRIKALINSVNPLSWVRTARYINQQKPDYVVVRYWLPFMAMSLGSILRMLRSEIRIIALVDNAVPHEQRPGDQLLTRYFLKKPQAYIAMSRAVLNDLKGMTTGGHFRFVPHPIYDIYGESKGKSTARSELGLNQSDKLLLFFGFIRKYKGLDLMLEALADERLKEMGVKLVIAGEFYDKKKPYLTKIETLKLKDRVIVRDHFIPSAEIAQYFCAADMVTQTYLSATQSGVTQIAYHFGRPMLVTDVGGLAEIVPHEKVGYVVPIDARAIANAIVDFYKNNREDNMARNVREEAVKFSWNSMVGELESLYEAMNTTT